MIHTFEIFSFRIVLRVFIICSQKPRSIQNVKSAILYLPIHIFSKFLETIQYLRKISSAYMICNYGSLITVK
jgi:hypothetical protein